MGKKIAIILFVCCVSSVTSAPQDVFYGPGFRQVVMVNPASAGMEGDGIIRMSYINQYPGRGFNLHTFFMSYDGFIPLFHGGIAGYILNDYTGGILNDLRGGFSYSYHLQAGKDFFINAGLSASVQHRGINADRIVLPDQIDPLQGAVLPSSENISGRGRSVFDVGTGFTLTVGNYFAGFAVNHLAKPDLEGSELPESILKRRLTMFASGNFDTGRRMKVTLMPFLFFDMSGKEILSAAGGAIAAGGVSLNGLAMINNNGDINLQTGFSIKKWKGLFFYNYCFNLTSANRLLPFSLYHQGGLSISLNNVDKRKTVKAINFPEL